MDGTFWLWFIGVIIYFLPSVIGGRKRNAAAIVALNLLAGWTFVGWVVAMVWALTAEPPTPVAPPATTSNASSNAPLTVQGNIILPIDPESRANRLKDLRDRGIISQTEFMEQIGRL